MIEYLLNIFNKKFSDFKGIYFFGSRARGDFHNGSDYDILLVFDRNINWKFENEVRDIVYGFMINNDLLIDCKISSQKDISDPSTPFEMNVIKEGIYYGV